MIRAISSSAASTHLRGIFWARCGSRSSRWRCVGDDQCETVLTDGVAALVANQVDLDDPGAASSHRAQVRPEIGPLRSEPGLVWGAMSSRFLHSPTRRRPMVAADIPVGGVAVSSSTSSSSNFRRANTSSPRACAQPLVGRHPQRRPADDHGGNDFRPYFGGWGALGPTMRGRAPCGHDGDVSP